MTFFKVLDKIYSEIVKKEVIDMMENLLDYQMFANLRVNLRIKELQKEAEELRMLKKFLKRKKEREHAPSMERERWEKETLLGT